MVAKRRLFPSFQTISLSRHMLDVGHLADARPNHADEILALGLIPRRQDPRSQLSR